MSTRAVRRVHPDYTGRATAPGRAATRAPRSTSAGLQATPRTMTRRTTARGGSEAAARRLLRAAGWTFIAMGCFVLFFLVYQLVGTDLITNREQSDLQRNLAREWAGPAPAAPARRGGASALPVPQA